MENENVRECKVLFGGVLKANKRDKATGVKLAEEYAKVQIITINTENNYVESKDYYISVEDYEKYASLNLVLLKPCYAYIEFSVTSGFAKLVDLKPVNVNK